MPLGRGGGAYSVGWEGGKNRETVTASVCLVVTELVALATATPDWSRDNRVHQSAAKWWQLEWQEVAIITSQLRPKWHRFQKNFLDTVLILIVCLLLVHEKIFHLVDPTPWCIFKRIARRILTTPALSELLNRFSVEKYYFLFFLFTEITDWNFEINGTKMACLWTCGLFHFFLQLKKSFFLLH